MCWLQWCLQFVCTLDNLLSSAFLEFWSVSLALATGCHWCMAVRKSMYPNPAVCGFFWDSIILASMRETTGCTPMMIFQYNTLSLKWVMYISDERVLRRVFDLFLVPLQWWLKINNRSDGVAELRFALFVVRGQLVWRAGRAERYAPILFAMAMITVLSSFDVAVASV